MGQRDRHRHAAVSKNLTHAQFVLRVGVGVQERNRHRLDLEFFQLLGCCGD